MKPAEPPASAHRESGVARVDHLVWATPDLDEGIRELERLTGVRASPGGKHPSWATHNALLALGPGIYLEILAPDPSVPRPPANGRSVSTGSTARGSSPGPPASRTSKTASRRSPKPASTSATSSPAAACAPTASPSEWRLTSPRAMLEAGVVPFLIDWGTSPHPSETAAPGLALVALAIEHPEPDHLRRLLTPFALDLPIHRASAPALVATIDSPRGRLELR